MKNKYVILGGGGSFAIHTAFYLLKQDDTDSVTGIFNHGPWKTNC